MRRGQVFWYALDQFAYLAGPIAPYASSKWNGMEGMKVNT